MHTQSTIPAPTNLYELATFPEPIFSARFSFIETVHPATFVDTILGVKGLSSSEFRCLLYTLNEENQDYLYQTTWHKDENIFRMFLLFVWEANQPSDTPPGSFYISPSTEGY